MSTSDGDGMGWIKPETTDCARPAPGVYCPAHRDPPVMYCPRCRTLWSPCCGETHEHGTAEAR